MFLERVWCSTAWDMSFVYTQGKQSFSILDFYLTGKGDRGCHTYQLTFFLKGEENGQW